MKITQIKAPGHLVLIELLEAGEALDTVLALSENAKLEAPQAYVLDIGPSVDRKAWGFDVGDRIVFSGMMTPMPPLPEQKRKRGTIEVHSVKAVLVEQSSLLAMGSGFLNN